jgi:hypothetical protein
MYADHLLPLVAEMLPQEGPKDNKPGCDPNQRLRCASVAGGA